MKRSRNRIFLAAAAAILAGAVSTAAYAQVSSAQQSAMRSNCRNDFMSYCSGVTPGGQEALGCLQKNLMSLSPGCKKAVSATIHTGARPAIAAAPAAAPLPPAAASREGPVPGGLLIDKACARVILMHCRGMGIDSERKVDCLVDYARAGNFMPPRCKAVLTMTGHLR